MSALKTWGAKPWDRWENGMKNPITFDLVYHTTTEWRTEKCPSHAWAGGQTYATVLNSPQRLRLRWKHWLKPCKVICRAMHVLWIYAFFENIVWISCKFCTDKPVANYAHKGCYDLGKQRDVKRDVNTGKYCSIRCLQNYSQGRTARIKMLQNCLWFELVLSCVLFLYSFMNRKTFMGLYLQDL